jgi:diphthine synthase
MVLYVIGLGLGDETDITLRGLNAIKTCDYVYLENYTSILGNIDHKALSAFYGREVILADRECVENDGADVICSRAKDFNVAFLVVGDPFCATTHTDLILRAKDNGAEVQVIPNASVMGAVGACGLQLYQYGQTVSIPFFTDDWRPDSFYDKIKFNQSGKLHTLCLLDIKVKEPDFEAMARGRTVYLPPRFMTINQALAQLIQVEDERQEGAYLKSETLCVGMARLGQPSQCIVAGTMEELLHVDFGGPLHCLVIAGEVHCLELEMLARFALAKHSNVKLPTPP